MTKEDFNNLITFIHQAKMLHKHLGELSGQLELANNDGGYLVTNTNAFQDNEPTFKVDAKVIVPFVEIEIAKTKAEIVAYEEKLIKMLEIINS